MSISVLVNVIATKGGGFGARSEMLGQTDEPASAGHDQEYTERRFGRTSSGGFHLIGESSDDGFRVVDAASPDAAAGLLEGGPEAGVFG